MPLPLIMVAKVSCNLSPYVVRAGADFNPMFTCIPTLQPYPRASHGLLGHGDKEREGGRGSQLKCELDRVLIVGGIYISAKRVLR